MTIKITFDNEQAYDHAINEAKAQALNDLADSLGARFGGLDPFGALVLDIRAVADAYITENNNRPTTEPTS